MSKTENTLGSLLREWRGHRRMSQLDLACEAEISTRHLSFVETGRSLPSRDMLLRLAERLSMPLRAQNRLMLAAGYAATHSEEPLDAPDMEIFRQTVRRILDGHMPFPAIAVDRRWTLVLANTAATDLFAGISPELLSPPINVLRLSLHPQGLSRRIKNLSEWRHHVIERLRIQIDECFDPSLSQLLMELRAYPAPPHTPEASPDLPSIAVPLELKATDKSPGLRLISTTTVFSTATSVTLSELALECFYPADEESRAVLMNLYERPRP